LYEGTCVTQNVKKPRQPSTSGRVFGALSLILSAFLAAATGCSTSECSGDECRACSDDDCAAGQRCVQNECRNDCETDADCEGDQVCRGYQFQVGDEGTYCVLVPGELPVGRGRFSPCQTSAECDEAHGFSCLEGECNYECQSHADCVAVGHCGSVQVDGASKHYCVHDEAPPKPGQLYTSCPSGTECGEPALCVGAGAGDLDAYCTIDCESDADCAAGYYCGSITRAPCEDACDAQAAPTDPRCAPADQIGAGKPYRCGELGPERSVCRQREFCSTCESDADCLATPNQICARDESGEKICTRLCDTGARSCPWGNAARCGVFDEELGVPTCSHRFGSCHGDGKTCEPCRSDADCPGGVCASSQFTGERWCINLDTHCECPNGADDSGTCSDGGCPKSPGGLPVLCVGTEDSSLYNLCYAANSATDSPLGSSPQTGCWGVQ
jgi:hypothetical protein